MTPDLACALPARALLGEGPLWDAAAPALHWVDMHDPETAPTGALYRLDADLGCHRVVDGLVCSNSLCLEPGPTPDVPRRHGPARRVGMGLRPETGQIANRRVFVRLDGAEGAAGRGDRGRGGVRVGSPTGTAGA